MYEHFVILSSSYADGKRIAIDFTGIKLDLSTIKASVAKIKSECGSDVQISTHYLTTESDSVKSIEEYDGYFKGVLWLNSIDEFIAKIKQGRTLSGIDIAKYILAKVKDCSHLKLQKLAYLCYADYLCSEHKRLFESEIYAFRYGPVVSDIYDVFKSSHHYLTDFSDVESVDEKCKASTTVSELPAKSRIMFAEDGLLKLSIVDKTLEKYGDFTASQLVSITHKQESPWSHVDSSKSYERIPDDIILQYHEKEI